MMLLRTRSIFGGVVGGLLLGACGSESSVGTDPNPGANPGPGNVSDPAPLEEPARCPDPTSPPRPASAPSETSTPTSNPAATNEPPPDPQATPMPQATPEPQATPMPQATPEPQATPVPQAESVQFIAWHEFETEDATPPNNPLSSPLDVRDVSPAWPYRDEDLLIAYGTESGNNTIVALSIDGRTARQHWPHFDCGDCRISASWAGSVILTATTLYRSEDGGYRYADIAEGDFVLADQERELGVVRAVEDRIWVQTASGWVGTSPDTRELSVPDWSRARVTSLDRAGALEVTARYITRHTEEGDAIHTDVCPAGAALGFDTAFHDGSFVVVPCEFELVRVTDGFPDEAPTEIALDSTLQWAGRYAVASLDGWYGVSPELRGKRLGSHPPLAEGEHVVGYLDSPSRGYRVTNLGIGVTTFAVDERCEPAD